MYELAVQRILTGFVRREAPQTYALESDALRLRFAERLRRPIDLDERRAIGWTYAQAKRALVVHLAREISLQAR